MHLKPISQIHLDLGINPNGRVQRFFTDTCYRHMDKYVPKQNGVLRANVNKGVDFITYESPYAHYQYIGKLYVMPHNMKGAYYNKDYGFWSEKGESKIPTDTPLNYKEPGTGAYWDRLMKTAEMDKVVREVGEYVKRTSK